MIQDKQKAVKVCAKIGFVSYCALIYFLPISNALVEIWSGIIISTLFVKKTLECRLVLEEGIGTKGVFLKKLGNGLSRSFSFIPHYLKWPLLAFITFNLLSVIFSQFFELSLRGFFCKLLQGIVLLVSFLDCMKTKKVLRIFLLLFFISLTLVTINGVYQHFHGKGFIREFSMQHDRRVMSSFKSPNDFGGYLLIPAGLLLGFLCFNWRSRVDKDLTGKASDHYFAPWAVCVEIILLCLTLTCLGFTFSRGAWMGFFFSLIFAGFLNKKTLIFLVILTAVFLVVFMPKMISYRNVTFLTDDVDWDRKHEQTLALQSPPGEEKLRLIEVVKKRVKQVRSRFGGLGRDSWWKDAFRIFKKSPFFGVGLNTYTRSSKEFYGQYPHNCFLQMAAETGILGLLSFLWILFCLYIKSFKAFFRANDRFTKAVLAGTMVGLFGFLWHSFVDTNMYTVQLGNFMWLIFGLLAGTERIAFGLRGSS